jgi:hypothetical protein
MNDSHSPRIYAIEHVIWLRAVDGRSRPNSLRVKALRMRPNGRLMIVSAAAKL